MSIPRDYLVDSLAPPASYHQDFIYSPRVETLACKLVFIFPQNGCYHITGKAIIDACQMCLMGSLYPSNHILVNSILMGIPNPIPP